jgi:hypothetical protein
MAVNLRAFLQRNTITPVAGVAAAPTTSTSKSTKHSTASTRGGVAESDVNKSGKGGNDNGVEVALSRLSNQYHVKASPHPTLSSLIGFKYSHLQSNQGTTRY